MYIESIIIIVFIGILFKLEVESPRIFKRNFATGYFENFLRDHEYTEDIEEDFIGR